MLGHLGGVVIVAMLLLRTNRAVGTLAGLYLVAFTVIMIYNEIQ